MNDNLIMPKGVVLGQNERDCVEVLTDALDEATRGRINSVALVVCMDAGIATVMAGKNGGALNLGCDDLKLKIHGAMFEDGNVAKPKARGSVIRVK